MCKCSSTFQTFVSLSVAVMSARALPFLLPLPLRVCLSAIAICLTANAVSMLLLFVPLFCNLPVTRVGLRSCLAVVRLLLFFFPVCFLVRRYSFFCKKILLPTIAVKRLIICSILLTVANTSACASLSFK